jgi:hypothetical protein
LCFSRFAATCPIAPGPDAGRERSASRHAAALRFLRSNPDKPRTRSFIGGLGAVGESRSTATPIRTRARALSMDRDRRASNLAHTRSSSALMHEAVQGSRFLATRPLGRDDSVFSNGTPDDANGMTGR